jgi:hypothetical protein
VNRLALALRKTPAQQAAYMVKIKAFQILAVRGRICCTECGDRRWDVLHADHIDNDGHLHRKQIGKGGNGAGKRVITGSFGTLKKPGSASSFFVPIATNLRLSTASCPSRTRKRTSLSNTVPTRTDRPAPTTKRKSNMTFIDVTDRRVQDAVSRIRALRRLTAETGVKTYKSQSAILESLPADVLASVALVLNPEPANSTIKGNENEYRFNR